MGYPLSRTWLLDFLSAGYQVIRYRADSLRQGVEPNLNPNRNPNEPFHFGEPEPNLNQQNFTSVNPNQT